MSSTSSVARERTVMMRFLQRRPRPRRRSPWHLVSYAVVGTWAVMVLVLCVAARDRRVPDSLAGPPMLLFSLTGTVGAARAATHPGLDARTRRAWRSMAVGYVLVFVSSVLFALVSGFPGPGDFPRLAAVAFFLHGLFGMTTSPRSRTQRVRAGLDIAVVVTAGTMAMWYWSLGPLTVMTTEVPVFSVMIAAAYPMADLVLVFGATAALVRGTHASTRRPLIIVVLGLNMLITADLQYANSSLDYLSTGVGGGSSSSPVLQWLSLLSAFGLLAVASLRQCAGAVVRPRPAVERRPLDQISLLPYVAIGGGYALLVAVATGAPLYPWGGLIIGAVTMTGIVVARQILVLRENRNLMTTDFLTGLATRPALTDALARALSRSQRSGTCSAVLVIDLDGFKAVNDEFGHEAGDELLAGFAGLLRGAVSRTDTVGRLGGDEFAVVLAEIGQPDDAVAVALRLLDAMRRPLTVVGRPLVSRASIGIALSRPGDTGRLIMHRADQAMYRAKRAATGWSLEGAPVAEGTPAAAQRAAGSEEQIGTVVPASRASGDHFAA